MYPSPEESGQQKEQIVKAIASGDWQATAELCAIVMAERDKLYVALMSVLISQYDGNVLQAQATFSALLNQAGEIIQANNVSSPQGSTELRDEPKIDPASPEMRIIEDLTKEISYIEGVEDVAAIALNPHDLHRIHFYYRVLPEYKANSHRQWEKAESLTTAAHKHLMRLTGEKWYFHADETNRDPHERAHYSAQVIAYSRQLKNQTTEFRGEKKSSSEG